MDRFAEGGGCSAVAVVGDEVSCCFRFSGVSASAGVLCADEDPGAAELEFDDALGCDGGLFFCGESGGFEGETAGGSEEAAVGVAP